jgi:hypothetical protein
MINSLILQPKTKRRSSSTQPLIGRNWKGTHICFMENGKEANSVQRQINRSTLCIKMMDIGIGRHFVQCVNRSCDERMISLKTPNLFHALAKSSKATFDRDDINSLTAIRVLAGTKNSRPVGFYSRNSTKSTVNPNTTIPQTLPPWWCRSPLIRRGIYGSARSDAPTLFQRGRAGGWSKRII